MNSSNVLNSIFLFACYVPISVSLSLANTIRNNLYLKDSFPYTTEERLYIDLEQEKERLGMSDLEITVRFSDHPSASAHFISKGNYEIELGHLRNKLALCHELYHVSKIRTSDIVYFPDLNLFYQREEWSATSYALSTCQ